ncbi:short-chain dehydrogenase [Candidatus Marinamargulisbacteria bacterium SCGC AG-410-N11]|nr:short-chain dehydrogenase [Candidatus Marinamargulisbacteria bacterium SCGC AG-410-N11]
MIKDKNILITGGNRGIGLSLTKQLIELENNVTVLCRQSSEELSQTQATVITDIDVVDESSLDKAKHLLTNQTFDILINNAGVLLSENINDLNTEGFERIIKQFQVNSLGPLRVTGAFVNQLTANSKVIMITSRMGSVEDNTSGGRYGYRMSKAALNIAAKSLSIDLKDRNIAVGVFHPGWVQTDMTGYTGHIDPDTCASRLIQRMSDLNLDSSGSFLHSDGSDLPW